MHTCNLFVRSHFVHVALGNTLIYTHEKKREIQYCRDPKSLIHWEITWSNCPPLQPLQVLILYFTPYPNQHHPWEEPCPCVCLCVCMWVIINATILYYVCVTQWLYYYYTILLLMTPKESLLHIGFYCTVHVLYTCLLSLGKLIRGGVGKLWWCFNHRGGKGWVRVRKKGRERGSEEGRDRHREIQRLEDMRLK